MKNGRVLSLSTACALLLVGCGGGSSTSSGDSDSEGAVLTGVFVDSPVEGLVYSTQTQSGTTNALGEFNYLAGEQVTFSIGATQLPAVQAADQLTPIDIAANGVNPADMTTNIARLLQSLDLDGNPDNGITIPETVATSEARLDFDVSENDFANDAATINLVANSGAVSTELISADAANEHLNETLGIRVFADDELVLDLRDSEWFFVGLPTACDGMSNQNILRYSQTRYSGETNSARILVDGSCSRTITPFDRAIDDLNGTGFLFACGGDALCTFGEINRSIVLSADDPRNGCIDSNGQSQTADRSISHVPGSDVFNYAHCNSSEFTGTYIRQ